MNENRYYSLAFREAASATRIARRADRFSWLAVCLSVVAIVIAGAVALTACGQVQPYTEPYSGDPAATSPYAEARSMSWKCAAYCKVEGEVWVHNPTDDHQRVDVTCRLTNGPFLIGEPLLEPGVLVAPHSSGRWTYVNSMGHPERLALALECEATNEL